MVTLKARMTAMEVRPLETKPSQGARPARRDEQVRLREPRLESGSPGVSLQIDPLDVDGLV